MVFAALIGRIFLQERLTCYRVIACIVVAIGALCIGHDGARKVPARVTVMAVPEPN